MPSSARSPQRPTPRCRRAATTQRVPSSLLSRGMRTSTAGRASPTHATATSFTISIIPSTAPATASTMTASKTQTTTSAARATRTSSRSSTLSDRARWSSTDRTLDKRAGGARCAASRSRSSTSDSRRSRCPHICRRGSLAGSSRGILTASASSSTTDATCTA